MVFLLTPVIYSLAALLTIISFIKDKEKTILALKKAVRSFEKILPQMLGIFVIIGISLTVLTPEMISSLIGEQSGYIGMLIAGAVGSITLIPGFIAYPLVGALVKSGAGITQATMFISTLLMVGMVTLPLEIKYYGKKSAAVRNGLAFLFSITTALIMGAILS